MRKRVETNIETEKERDDTQKGKLPAKKIAVVDAAANCRRWLQLERSK